MFMIIEDDVKLKNLKIQMILGLGGCCPMVEHLPIKWRPWAQSPAPQKKKTSEK
jgi:hypothetical protein